MYCPQCGGANEDAARECGTCGLDLDEYRRRWQTFGAQAVEEPPSQAYSAPPHPHQYEPAHRVPPYEPPRYGQMPYGPAPPHVPSYLGWAIAVLILCFWPTGIAAVVYASQVDNRLIRGDIAGAQESSRKAKLWCWISFGISVGLVVLAIVVVLFAAVLFTGTGSTIY